MSDSAVLMGGIFGMIFWVGLIVSCVVLCCLCCKKCCKGPNRRLQTVATTTVVYAPAQFLPGYQPSYLGYQPVQPGYVGPPYLAASPPSYLEATNPAHSSADFIPALPMHPSQPYALPSHTDELAQLPYNRTYGPKR